MADLVSAGVPVVALGAELDGFGGRLKREGFDFREIAVPLRGVDPIGDLRLLVEFYRLFRSIRPQVVHGFTIKPVIYGTIAAALAGTPRRICTITGLGHSFTDGGRLVNGVAMVLYRLALSRAHVVFFQNAEDRDLFVARRLVDAGKTRLTAGSGVDLQRFRPAPLRPGLGRRPVRFLMVSRLLREKGVMEFVEAAEQVAAQGLAAEFHLVGARDSRNPTGLSPAELARLEASPVTWTGPTDDVRAALAQSDVVVLPSYREGTPRSLLEAMATGRPVVTTDTPGCRQLVIEGVNGRLVPVRDPAALAGAMRALIQAPEQVEPMGLAARDFVARNYDERAVVQQTVAAYQLAALGDRR